MQIITALWVTHPKGGVWDECLSSAFHFRTLTLGPPLSPNLNFSPL